MMIAHMSMNGPESTPAGQAGFSLFEVMIAMVIMMVGLMGLAAMQDIALSGNMDANEVTRVTALATDLIDRISYNKKNVLAYAGPTCASIPTCIDTTAAIPCTHNAVTQAQARGDCLQWDFRVDNSGLRNARGMVTVAPAGPIMPNSTAAMLNVVNITITWTGAKRAKTVTMSSIVAID